MNDLKTAQPNASKPTMAMRAEQTQQQKKITLGHKSVVKPGTNRAGLCKPASASAYYVRTLRDGPLHTSYQRYCQPV